MAFLQCSYFSKVLQINSSMNVILPDRDYDNPPAMLYLLHGLNGDHTTWMRRTCIERYAHSRNVAVFMPAVNRSFYSTMAHGPDYWKFISEELPQIIKQLFRLDEAEHDAFVLGNSMGGYGAFKFGLNFPGRFKAVASLAGSLDLINIGHAFKDDPDLQVELDTVFNRHISSLTHTESDLVHLLKTYPTDAATRFYQYCGTEDYLYEFDQHFKKKAEAAGLNLTYLESEGDHSWNCWEPRIESILDWFDIEKVKEEIIEE
ncbi:alpha/beta hydrolase [Verrucomicrobiota bacterium]